MMSTNIKCNFDTNCHAIVAYSSTEKAVVLSFRGMKGGKQLLAEAIDAIEEKIEFGGGKVFRYFYDSMMGLYPQMISGIQQVLLQHPVYEVWLTGHSLGGALASLSAVKLVIENATASEKIKLITFGQPRVGEKNFSDSHDRLIPYSFRVTHRLDLVPHIPPCHQIPEIHGCFSGHGTFFACHHSVEVFFPAQQMQINDYVVCSGDPVDEDSNCSDGLRKKGFTINDHHNYYNHSFSTAMRAYCRHSMISTST